jgi:uncharacterized protein YukE
MTVRVLSTDVAKQTIVDMQNVINGPLLDQISKLDKDGNILSDPNQWDGNLAVQFRSDWVNTSAVLHKTQQALDQLRANIQKINQNIMTSGGND